MKIIYILVFNFILILTFSNDDLWAQEGEQRNLIHNFEKIQLSSTFYAEGAGIGDINGNGHPDVVCGPYWYEGPNFTERKAYYEPVPFDPLRYSDNFIVAVDDVNDNGLNDILVVGFPGQDAVWYENPGEEEGHWPRHLIHSTVDNEAQRWVDLTGDGNLELLFHTDGYLGYAQMDPDDPTKPWTFNQVSEQSGWYRFTHGLGVGDINGNGHKDFIMNDGWWENPGPDAEEGQLWEHHQVDFGRDLVWTGESRHTMFNTGGSQMFAYDVDGDGLNDVITSLNAHGWGLAWFKQVQTDEGVEFEKQLIMGSKPEDNPYGVRFSQLHALQVVDMDNSGLKDIVTGKRWWAHGPDGDYEPNAPAVIYWFKLDRGDDGKVNYIPYLIDDDSGVGVQFDVGDLTGNGYPDIVTCNKKGGHVFLNWPEEVSREEWEAAQPEKIWEITPPRRIND